MGKKILVVDDSSVMRAAISFALSAAGFEVEPAENGKIGLETLRGLVEAGTRPAAILVDVNMPVMDGITFIKHVKRSSCQFVPILVLTTESEERKKQEGKEAGAAGWMVKPFKDTELVAVVRKFTRS